MNDILSKMQDILDDPQKLEGFKNLASSLLSKTNDDANNETNNNKTSNSQETNHLSNMNDIENILKNFINNENKNENKDDVHNKNTDQIDMPLNIDMILKFKNAMELMNKDDNNIAFLRSLKMLLGDKRQQKVDSAIKIIRLIKIMPLIKELDLLKDFKII